MEKEIPTPIPSPKDCDLKPWRDFQAGLSALLDVTLSLYDADGNLVVPADRLNCVCEEMDRNPRGRKLCRETYSMAVSQVLESKDIHIFKCHTNQYIFAVPVFIDDNSAFVIVGGRTYLEGDETADFFNGLEPFLFDEGTLSRLKHGMKIIPRKSIFTIPSIVNNLAAPFLKSLCTRRALAPAGGPTVIHEDTRLMAGFNALEEVFKSIAPVLDREELYEKILAKSTELIGAERGSLMILDSKHNMLSVKAAKGIERHFYRDITVRVGEGISGAIVAHGTPLMVRDIETEVVKRKNIPGYKTKSFIAVPLKLDDRVIGVINVSDKITGEVFNEEDLHMLLSFANYASIALERGAYYSMSEEFKMISMTDPLTGLFNRRYFRERLFEEVERVKRHSECFTIFVIDVDNFKIFNDKYGHIAGDDILKRVSRSIRNTVRSMDVVARYGGEEFTVILPHTNKKESFVIAERIRKEIEGMKPSSPEITEHPTISVGIAEFPLDANSIEELIHNADRAMYVAKRQGKNMVVFYEK